MIIDSHVHCRDEGWAGKGETIEHMIGIAPDCGVIGLFDMPNNKPETTTRERVKHRLELARQAQEKHQNGTFYGLFVGVTSDPGQIVGAVQMYDEFNPGTFEGERGVVGLKMFAGRSTGDLAIVDEDDQKRVYEVLTDAGYKGPLVVHCEKEAFIERRKFTAVMPWTHNDAQPEQAETESIYDQIDFAKRAGYEGRLHIAHVTTPTGAELVDGERGNLKISCGVNPAHLILSTEQMYTLGGVYLKVNPPIRPPTTRDELLGCFLRGMIDTLESDHAPHTLDEKVFSHMSGLPQFAAWPEIIMMLRGRGALQADLDKMTFYNVNKIYGTQIEAKLGLRGKIGKHVERYTFNPYKFLKKDDA
ncbi:MAG: hypothetical protein ABIE22_00850 [archaeon]